MKKLLIWALLISVAACTSSQIHSYQSAGLQKGEPPKNIILFIGDGMGVTQVTAGKIRQGMLNLERFKTMGLLMTYAHDALVTDSAAAGTALVTGEKTINGAISVSPENMPLKTVLECAEEQGKTTGMVVTGSVTDATPAVFVSHQDTRRKKSQIAEDMATSGVDVLFGGGWAYFVPHSVSGSKRNDNKDLIRTLEERMTVVRSVEELRNLDDSRPVAALLVSEELPKADERHITLSEMTQKAIRILSQNSKGFFLMVEGSQIDCGGHDHDPDYITMEVIDFDQAVGTGLDFADSDKKTLVVVTADHETGGFAIQGGSVDNKTITESGFTTTGHTAAMVPLFAFGPGSETFGGIQDNTFVGKTLIRFIHQTD